MNDFFFLTVRHTGTNFGFQFLTNIGLTHNDNYRQLHVEGYAKNAVTPYEVNGIAPFTKILTTARDPLLGAIRLSGTMADAIRVKASQRKIDHLAWEWNYLIDLLPKIDHHIIDIGCHESERYKHLCNAARFIGINPLDWPDLNRFAEAWMPVNVGKDPCAQQTKLHYLETGELPTQIDYSGLNRAVAWYKNLPTN